MGMLHMTNAVSFLNNDCKLVGGLDDCLPAHQGGGGMHHGRMHMHAACMRKGKPVWACVHAARHHTLVCPSLHAVHENLLLHSHLLASACMHTTTSQNARLQCQHQGDRRQLQGAADQVELQGF